MSTMTFNFGVKLIATAVLVSVSTSSFAEAERTVRSVAVQYSSHELSTAAGSAKVYERIRQAAKMVCRPDIANTVPTIARDVALRCYRATMAQTINDINDHQLSAVHQTRTRLAAR